MNSISKIRCLTSTLWALTLIFSAAAANAGDPEIPKKYLSFFSEQFIGHAPLRDDIRPQCNVREEKEREFRSSYVFYSYYFKETRLDANLEEWKDSLKTLNAFDSYDQFYSLIDLIYHLDLKTLATIYEQPETSDKRWIKQLADVHVNIDSMWNLVSLIRNIARKEPAIVEYLLFMKACHESGIIVSTGSGKHPLQDINDKRRPQPKVAKSPFIAGKAHSDGEKNEQTNDLLAQGIIAYKKTDSEWLKIRYACQLMTLARYAELYEKVVALHDDLLTPLHPERRIRSWARDQKTEALERLECKKDGETLPHTPDENASERSAKEREDLMMIDFSIGEEPPSSLHGIARIWATKALDSSRSSRMRLTSILRVHEFAPQSAFLENLLVWALLKCEENDFSGFLEQPGSLLDMNVLSEFQQLTLWIAGKEQVRRPALWYLAAGYLAFMQSFVDDTHSREAIALLEKAERMAKNDLSIQHQARLLRHLLPLYQPGRISSRFRKSLYPELQWLADRGETMILQTVMTALAQKLLVQGDVPQAICCLYAANNTMMWPETPIETKQAMANFVLDMYAEAEDVEDLYTFMTRNSHSKFERFLLERLPLSPDEVLDVWGTHLLRGHEFEQALRVFTRIAPDYWGRENVCQNDWEEGRETPICAKSFRSSMFETTRHNGDRFFDTNKLEFTNAVLQLERKARRDRAHAGEYYRQIADAFYSTPYWGYSGILWHGSLTYMFKYVYSADDWNTYYYFYENRCINYPFNAAPLKEMMLRREQDFLMSYATRTFAMEYYKKALRAARDAAFVEEMLTMMRQCAERPTVMDMRPYHERRAVLFPKDEFYHEMTRYPHTAAYRELLEESATFQDYLRLH